MCTNHYNRECISKLIIKQIISETAQNQVNSTFNRYRKMLIAYYHYVFGAKNAKLH